jgi:hypothetical protein
MAYAIDPTGRAYIETIKLPGGRFKGKTLLEAGQHAKGLVYLYDILNAPKPPTFLKRHFRETIKQFLALPERYAVLSAVLKRAEKR